MTRHPNIRYTYTIDGHRYESNVVDVFWTPINGGLNAQEIVNTFPVEKETACWVNPKNRQDSSLQRGWQAMHCVAFLPLILIIPGLALHSGNKAPLRVQKRNRRTRTIRPDAGQVELYRNWTAPDGS